MYMKQFVKRKVSARWHIHLMALHFKTVWVHALPSCFLLVCIFDGISIHTDSGGAHAAEVGFHSDMVLLSLAPSFTHYDDLKMRLCFVAEFSILFPKCVIRVSTGSWKSNLILFIAFTRTFCQTEERRKVLVILHRSGIVSAKWCKISAKSAVECFLDYCL